MNKTNELPNFHCYYKNKFCLMQEEKFLASESSEHPLYSTANVYTASGTA